MFRRACAAFFACLLLGVAPLAAIPALRLKQTADFARLESYFEYPIPLVSSIAGIRRDGFGKGHFGASRDGGRTHEGIDLLVEVRMPIRASKSGRVVFAGLGKGYGKYVEIAHPDGRSTRYAHLSEVCHQKGDWVHRGDVIGVSGKTGNAANRHIRPHLHFEIRYAGKAINPVSGPLNPTVRLK